jgi:hypothetical protein
MSRNLPLNRKNEEAARTSKGCITTATATSHVHNLI